MYFLFIHRNYLKLQLGEILATYEFQIPKSKYRNFLIGPKIDLIKNNKLKLGLLKYEIFIMSLGTIHITLLISQSE